MATQARAEVRYGPAGLELMRSGCTAAQALAAVMAADPEVDLRQAAMVDAGGGVAVHTGRRCIAQAGHRMGDSYSVQANLMERGTVWDAMAVAFESAGGQLAERMLLALEAAEDEGGDIRGRQSAAMLVVSGRPSPRYWEDRMVDLRVEDHAEPLVELRRLLRLKRAYQSLAEADQAFRRGGHDPARAGWKRALELAPELAQVQFAAALGSSGTGDLEAGVKRLRKLTEADPRWLETMRRMAAAGLLDRELAAVLEARLGTAQPSRG